MRSIWLAAIAAAGLAVAPAAGQSWEVGGAGGFGFTNNVAISNPVGAATAGLGSGASFGGVLTHHMYSRLSGDLRYSYRMNDLELAGSGQSVGFKAVSHIVHYDVLYHLTTPRQKVRPFVAGGAGMRFYRATGREAAFQPLEDYALLTRTQQVKPLISVGAGVSVVVSDRISLRMEFRDYVTPFPDQVIAPAPGAKAKGWLHDFVPMFGLSYRISD